MATVDEVLVTGRKYRIFDSVNRVWKRISYWTKASDVEFDDGLNAEDEVETLVKKQQLIFELDGDDLYITKTY